jgi:hypothetical protein
MRWHGNRGEFKGVREVAEFLADLFAARGWQYGHGTSGHVPDANELYEVIYDLLRDVGVGGELATGRILVTHDPELGREVYLSLLQEWEGPMGFPE